MATSKGSSVGPLRVLDAPPSDIEDDDHSNVIPVLPLESRDNARTGSTMRRTRREAAVEGDRLRGRGLLGQRSNLGPRSAGENVVMHGTDDERRPAAAATITVSHYVTG